MKTVLNYLEQLEDPRRDAIIAFHKKYEHLINVAKGSGTKHQAWPGGYIHHLRQIFWLATINAQAVLVHYDVECSVESAIIVLYFHDVEKIWKYTEGLPEDFDKDVFLFETLKDEYGIEFTEDEKNALEYVHGEPVSEHSPTERLMGPLAAICHTADNLSARVLHDKKLGRH